MADFKVIEKTLQSGSNILEVTDATLNNNSIFEVYTDDVNVIPVNVSVSGTTATITFDSKPTTATGVKIFINNLDGEYIPPTSGDTVEVTDAVQYGSLICKISVNGEVTEIRSGTISANNVRYYDSHGSDMTQFEFNNTISDRIDNLDANDILYDENSTLYSAMGDIDSLTTTSKNLVGAINEVKSSGSDSEIIDVSDSFSTTYTIDSKVIEKYGKLVIGTIMMYCNTSIPTGSNFVLGQITYKPTSYVQFMSPLPYLSQGTQKFGHYNITTTGNVRIRPNSAINSGDYLLIRFSYLTND